MDEYQALIDTYLLGGGSPTAGVTTQQVFFQILQRAGWTDDEMKKLADECTKNDGRWENERLAIQVDGNAVNFLFKD